MKTDNNTDFIYQPKDEMNGSHGVFSLTDRHDFISVSALSDIRDTFLQELQKPHINDCYIISLYTGGQGTYCFDDEIVRVEKGSVIFLHPGQVCSIVYETDMEGVRIAFSPHVYDNMDQHLANVIRFVLFRKLNILRIEAGDFYKDLKELFMKLLSDSNSDTLSEMYNPKLYSLLYYIMVKIYEHSPYYNEGVCAKSQSLELFIRFLAMVDSYYSTRHLVKEYSKALNVSQKDLTAITKEHSNKSPHEIIMEKCIFEAKRLLRHSDLSVKAIASQLGYSESSNFSMVFKRYARLSPQEYREQEQAEAISINRPVAYTF